jgi:hypothetical protein
MARTRRGKTWLHHSWQINPASAEVDQIAQTASAAAIAALRIKISS